MNLRTADNLFDGISNHIDVDPSTIRLISDRVLIRDVEDEEKIGSIVIPESAREKTAPGKDGRLRIGVVVAVGPGDKFLEHGLNAQGSLRLTRITRPVTPEDPCSMCRGKDRWFDIREYRYVAVEKEPCPYCIDGRVPVTVPPQCRVGDRVLYDRRRHEEMVIGGVVYSLLHAEQAVWAVLE